MREICERLIGISDAVRELKRDLAVAVTTSAPVLISGERGVGKGAIARMIHQRGRRGDAALIAIDGTAVPDQMLESTIFGFARAGSPASQTIARGCLERAHRGTLLLDDVGRMGPRVQAALLRFLETGTIQPVGADAPRAGFDVRVVATSTPDLFAQVTAKRFREDLFYRLNVLHLKVAPLRERQEDIPELLNHFLTFYAADGPEPRLTSPAMRLLESYQWPGNVSELRGVAERLAVRRSLVLSAQQVKAEISPRRESSPLVPDRGPVRPRPAVNRTLGQA